MIGHASPSMKKWMWSVPACRHSAGPGLNQGESNPAAGLCFGQFASLQCSDRLSLGVGGALDTCTTLLHFSKIGISFSLYFTTMRIIFWQIQPARYIAYELLNYLHLQLSSSITVSPQTSPPYYYYEILTPVQSSDNLVLTTRY